MKTLFIGNSYTYFNDLPALFAGICEENGVHMEVDSITLGGYTLSSYLNPSDMGGYKLAKILESGEKFNYVVLQEQSCRPATEPERFYAAAKIICDAFAPTGAEMVFYETWGRRDDHAFLAESNMTHEEMQEKLKAAYEAAAKQNNAAIVYAGEKFHEAYRGELGDTVFAPDGTHPSAVGSALIARVFYDTLIAK